MSVDLMLGYCYCYCYCYFCYCYSKDCAQPYQVSPDIHVIANYLSGRSTTVPRIIVAASDRYYCYSTCYYC